MKARWLTQLNYSDRTQWEQVNLTSDVVEVQAYVKDSHVDATGALTANADSAQTIDASSTGNPTSQRASRVAI